MSLITYSAVLDGLKVIRDILPYFGSGRYKRFFQKTHVLCCIANHEGVFVDVNPALIRFLGYEKSELIGIKFMRLIHQDDHVKTLEAMASLKSGGEVFRFRNRYLCADGLYRTLEWEAIGNGEIYATARPVEEKRVHH